MELQRGSYRLSIVPDISKVRSFTKTATATIDDRWEESMLTVNKSLSLVAFSCGGVN